ncbi:class I glutamine amidotransferase-like protein [Gongronella butleri]|nr:class I glutamine amidotransferase-like protein [Gongronella butleri]
MSKVLLVISSYNGVFYADGKKTGLYFTEAYHPWKEFTEHGLQVDLVTETGTFGFDEHSVTADVMSADDFAAYSDSSSGFMHQLHHNLKKAADINPDDYNIVFLSAGHSTLYDYPKATHLIRAVESIYAKGGIVSAVCHAPIILPQIKDASGASIIKGKTITGFSTEGEIAFSVMDKIKADGLQTVEEGAAAAGAKYVAPETPLAVCIQQDGRVLTGANPASASPLAQLTLQVLKQSA